MNYALIKAEKVVNTIIADEAFVQSIESEWDVIVPFSEGSGVGIGWNYDGTKFIEPELPPAPEVEQSVEKKITRLAFLSRFTDAEAIALDLASIGATVEAAAIRRYMQKVNAATFIDLAREDTIAGVNQLETVGLLGAGRANAILTDPITDLERAR